MKKFSLLLVLTLMLSVFAAGCGTNGNDNNNDDNNGNGGEPVADTSLDDVLERGTLVMGMDIAFPPMGFVGENEELTGFDVDLAQAVCEKLGIELEPKAIDWSTKEMELKNGNIDVIWNGYTMSAARDEKVEYTKPYLNNRQVIAVAIDSDINSRKELEGKMVGTQVNSAGLYAIQADVEFAESLAEIREYDDFMTALLDLETSRLDAVVVDEVVIEYLITQQPDKYRILDEAMGVEYYGIGCPKGAVALQEAIDKALDELMEDGTIDEISTKWFGKNIVIRDVPRLTAEDYEKL